MAELAGESMVKERNIGRRTIGGTTSSNSLGAKARARARRAEARVIMVAATNGEKKKKHNLQTQAVAALQDGNRILQRS